MKQMKNNNYWEIIIIEVILMISLIIVVFLFFSLKEIKQDLKVQKLYSEAYLCKSYSLEGTSFCLRDTISGVYNYKITPNILQDNEKIINEGGDCLDYSLLYGRLLLRMGFDAEVVIEEDKGHAFVRVKLGSETCILDLLKDSICEYENLYFGNSTGIGTLKINQTGGKNEL